MGSGDRLSDLPAVGGTFDHPRQTYSGKTPKLSIFNGEEVPEKHKISFEWWLFKVRTLQWTYPKSTIKDAIVRSHKGPTTDLMYYLGSGVSVARMSNKLETIYGIIVSYDVLMQN